METIAANCQAVGMMLDQSVYTLGRHLKFNPKTEKFVGDGEADQLLTRAYREPFVVPEEV